MEMPRNANENSDPRAVSYRRHSIGLQAENWSVETQKRVIAEDCARRGWSDLIWYEDEIAADSTAEETASDETTESK